MLILVFTSKYIAIHLVGALAPLSLKARSGLLLLLPPAFLHFFTATTA